MDAWFSVGRASACRFFFLQNSNEKQSHPVRYRNPKTRQAEARPTTIVVIFRKEWRAGKEAGRRKTRGVLLLDSAPPDSSDDSELVLPKPPSRLGGTAFGDFGGSSYCTFHSGLRSSSEQRPGYSLLPHLYQDAHKISPPHPSGQFRQRSVARASACGVSSSRAQNPAG